MITSVIISKYGPTTSGRDTHFTIPTFDFYFKEVLPKANKERIITERDYLGRIVHSKTLSIVF